MVFPKMVIIFPKWPENSFVMNFVTFKSRFWFNSSVKSENSAEVYYLLVCFMCIMFLFAVLLDFGSLNAKFLKLIYRFHAYVLPGFIIIMLPTTCARVWTPGLFFLDYGHLNHDFLNYGISGLPAFDLFLHFILLCSVHEFWQVLKLIYLHCMALCLFNNSCCSMYEVWQVFR
jgi:hypothetical protein